MSLEPSEEQLHELAQGNETWGYYAQMFWPLIRDMVLEEAAKAVRAEMVAGAYICDEDARHNGGLVVAMEAILAMKGTP